MATGNDWLEELKSRVSIVDVVSRYMPLTQKGRNHWGCCPFHHEKTPSFAVDPDRNAYKCFGCGASGDAIKFVEETESVDFMSACKILAERVGYQIPDHRRNKESEENVTRMKQKKQRMLALLKAAARFYYGNLKRQEAKSALDYMAARKIPEEIAKAFGLGVSLNWDGLPQYLDSAGFTREEQVESGACAEKSGKVYDALGGRLIFPIIDGLGDVIAFGGRLLEKSDFAKYKNTTQTMLFNKRKTLYGMNLLKKLRREQAVSDVIIVEGYMDTLSLWQGGFRNTVASMGTSLTVEQAQMLKRLVDKVYISYDGDAAGQGATLRGLDILQEQGLEVLVVSLPDRLDPDDVIKQRGAEEYRRLLSEALSLTDYKLELLRREHDLDKPEEKRKYVLRALRVIAKLPSYTEQEVYLKRVKAITGILFETLKKDLDNVKSGGNTVSLQEAQNAAPADSGLEKAMRFILCAMIGNHDYAYAGRDLSQYAGQAGYRELYDRLVRAHKAGTTVTASELYDDADDGQKAILDKILNADYGTAGRSEEQFFVDCAASLERNELQMQINLLTAQLETEQDAAERSRLNKLIMDTTLNMRKTRSR